AVEHLPDLLRSGDEDASLAAPVPAANTTVAPAVTAAATTRAPASTPTPAPPAASEQDIARQRAAVTKALAATDGLQHPMWISNSTLAVNRLAPEERVMPAVCRELERYPGLILTRVQLNPPEGSGEQVHWRQCGVTPTPTGGG
ncbi:MAG: hypothetical protein QM601_10220, partial [Pseudoxanthomonas sp.]